MAATAAFEIRNKTLREGLTFTTVFTYHVAGASAGERASERKSKPKAGKIFCGCGPSTKTRAFDAASYNWERNSFIKTFG